MSAPRLTVAFAMFVQNYDPEHPTDLRQMTTGIGGWRAEAPPTMQLTLALGLWNTGAARRVTCKLGVQRPGEDLQFIGEGDTDVTYPRIRNEDRTASSGSPIRA